MEERGREGQHRVASLRGWSGQLDQRCIGRLVWFVVGRLLCYYCALSDSAPARRSLSGEHFVLGRLRPVNATSTTHTHTHTHTHTLQAGLINLTRSINTLPFAVRRIGLYLAPLPADGFTEPNTCRTV